MDTITTHEHCSDLTQQLQVDINNGKSIYLVLSC